MNAVLEVEVSIDYPKSPEVVSGVRLALREGEILGLAGESGSGKSTIALAVLNLLGRRGATVRGRVALRGRDLLAMSDREMRAVRGRDIALVLQNAMAALNPRLRLGTQFREVWRAHDVRRGAWREIAVATLAKLGLGADDRFFDRYPGELSIGMAQRVLLALAVLHRPSVLIADEPTSALDLVNQAELLNLFRSLRAEFGTAILFISHDLLALAATCDRISVLRGGRLVETVAAADLFEAAGDPYTRRLIDALPRVRCAPERHPLRAG